LLNNVACPHLLAGKPVKKTMLTSAVRAAAFGEKKRKVRQRRWWMRTFLEGTIYIRNDKQRLEGHRLEEPEF
jgi:hypothetical protein